MFIILGCLNAFSSSIDILKIPERNLQISLNLFVSQLIEDLRKQLEHLQLYKLEAEAKRGRTPGAGLQEYQTRTREAELEQEIRRLKQVVHPFLIQALNFMCMLSFSDLWLLTLPGQPHSEGAE